MKAKGALPHIRQILLEGCVKTVQFILKLLNTVVFILNTHV